jgi:hypothetical protein
VPRQRSGTSIVASAPTFDGWRTRIFAASFTAPEESGNYWSVRIGLGHRALALEHQGDLIWFWIGDHGEYDRLIQNQ